MHVPDQHHLETKVIYDCSVIAGNSEHESALRTHHDQYNASKANWTYASREKAVAVVGHRRDRSDMHDHKGRVAAGQATTDDLIDRPSRKRWTEQNGSDRQIGTAGREVTGADKDRWGYWWSPVPSPSPPHDSFDAWASLVGSAVSAGRLGSRVVVSGLRVAVADRGRDGPKT
jgi:hypothetical protein